MGALLRHIDTGEGPAIVLLHGLYSCAEAWLPVIRRLSPYLRVIAMDLRNHGRSPHLASHTYCDMAHDVQSTLHSIGVERAHLLGHSMGGRVAAMLAQLYPQCVNRLVLADIGPQTDPNSPIATQRLQTHQRLLEELINLNIIILSSFAQADAAMEAAVPDIRLRRSMLKNLERLPSGEFRWRLNLPVLLQHLPEVLHGVSIDQLPNRVLLLRGEMSNYVSDNDLRTLKQHCPALQQAVVAGAGHWLHADSPHQIAELTLRFALGA